MPLTAPPLRRTLTLLAAALALAAPLRASAGGIQLYEVGTAEVGLAAAGRGARAQDAATVLFNPAGMARLEDQQLEVGAQVLYGGFTFAPDAGTSPGLGDASGGAPVGWFPGGGVYFSSRVTPELSVGMAAAGTFGMALSYDPDWAGRYYVTDATLAGISLLPSASWRVNEKLSVGASLHVMYGALTQKAALNTLGGADGELSLDDTDWGFGGNVGVLLEPGARTRLGLVWTSPVKLGFGAKAKFSGISPALRALLDAAGLTTGTVDLGVEVPQTVTLSAFHQLGERWALLGSAAWQQWSRFGMLEVGLSDVNAPTSTTHDLSYDDTWHVALGGQFWPVPAWRIDAGVAWDSSFQGSSNVSPLLPVDASWRFGVGVHHAASDRFAWGASAEYAYGGTLHVDRQGQLPPALGGRGDLSGEYANAGILFLALNLGWKL